MVGAAFIARPLECGSGKIGEDGISDPPLSVLPPFGAFLFFIVLGLSPLGLTPM